MLHNFCNEDYCDFEADPEVSCFLTEDLADDDGDWIRNTVNIIKTCFRVATLFVHGSVTFQLRIFSQQIVLLGRNAF